MEAHKSLEAPIIRLRKSPGSPINVADLFWLPADGSYGNLLPKLMKIHQRVGEINRLLGSAFDHWSAAMSGEISDAATKHVQDVEYTVFQ